MFYPSGNLDRDGDAGGDADIQNETDGIELEDDTLPDLGPDSDDDDVPFLL